MPMLKFAAISVAGAALLCGQTKPPSGPANPTPNLPPTNTPRPNPNPTTTGPGGLNPTSPFPGDIPRPIMITGKVVLSDGTPPPPSILIERVCASGRPHPEGYTDSKGHFTFTLGQEIGILPDASEAPTRSTITPGNPMGGIRESELMSCELRANLAGYRSDMISLAGHRMMDNSDVGTMVLHRVANVEGLTISATSALAPKDAKKAYEKGVEAEKKSKPDDAQKDLEKAVEVYPKYAAAWFELGRVYEGREHLDKAREAYNQSIAADSKFVSPYERLYMLAVKDAKWQEAADTTERVIRLNPYDFPGAFYFNAIANLQLSKLDAAEKSAREAVKLDPRHENPRTNYVLGIVLAQKQDFSGAAECLREYLKEVPQGKDSDKVRQQLADIEKVAQAKQNQ